MITHDTYDEVTIAGFGGQGVILAGKILAHSAMRRGHEVTYMPSYGVEVRGGTANCSIIISPEPIASPIVTHPRTIIIMNLASFHKFLPRLKPEGLLIMNRSKVSETPNRSDIEAVSVPADDIALELGNSRCANMVMLGAYLQKRAMLQPADAIAALSELLAKRHQDSIPINERAILRGAEFVRNQD